MSSKPVVIEVTRGPLVESRHEGIAAIVRSDRSEEHTSELQSH